jgi:molybdopterin synthase sulfur carrier subunit
MAISILIFGQLTDITGADRISLPGIADTTSLINELNDQYPELINVKYRIAVDKKIITGNVAINEHSTIALMPPFSGG